MFFRCRRTGGCTLPLRLQHLLSTDWSQDNRCLHSMAQKIDGRVKSADINQASGADLHLIESLPVGFECLKVVCAVSDEVEQLRR